MAGCVVSAETAKDTLPSLVDLRPEFERMGFAPRLQGDRPTCSVFTVAGAIEFAAAKQQGHCPRLSIEFLNWAANIICGEVDDGAFFSDLWKGFAQYGVCSEADMPYEAKLDASRKPDTNALASAKTRLSWGLQLHWIKEWNVNTGLTDDHFTSIKRTLSKGWPVCGGFRWPKKEQWTNDALMMCSSNAVRDGHSVLLVGYRDDESQPGGGVFIFRNTAHSGRDGFMPYTYAMAYMNDAVWINSTSRTKAQRLSPRKNNKMVDVASKRGQVAGEALPAKPASRGLCRRV